MLRSRRFTSAENLPPILASGESDVVGTRRDVSPVADDTGGILRREGGMNGRAVVGIGA
jgi:hypothetical protein